MANGCNSCAAKQLQEGAKRPGISWECADGICGQDLTFDVKDPELYAIVKAWPKLDQKLRDVLAKLVEMAQDQ